MMRVRLGGAESTRMQGPWRMRQICVVVCACVCDGENGGGGRSLSPPFFGGERVGKRPDRMKKIKIKTE